MKLLLGKGARAVVAVLVLQLAGCVARPTWHGDEGTAFDILNESTIALLRIDRSVLDGAFGSAMREACAVFVFPGTDTGIPTSAAARGEGVLLARDRSSGHWNGPAFYTLRSRAADAARHGWFIAVGCDAWHRLYTDAEARTGSDAGSTPEPDTAALSGMAAWTLSSSRLVPTSLDAIALRSLPVIASAYYQAPASLKAVMVDRSVRNDASAEILAAIERLAN